MGARRGSSSAGLGDRRLMRGVEEWPQIALMPLIACGDGVKVKYVPTDEDLAAARELGAQAAKLKAGCGGA